MSRYIGPVKWLGGIAIALFVLAFIFSSLIPTLPEVTQRSVLIQAVPFFMTFVGILLIFILLIVLVALRFNGKVPRRTYKGIENLTIAGILFATVCLFNPWSIVPFRYGFLLLLASTLTFILWSHVIPPRVDYELTVAPLTRTQHIVGIVVGLIILVVLVSSIVSMNSPKVPYGLRERVWNSYTPERQAEVAAQAVQQFQTIEMPFLLLFNLFPALAAYFIAREITFGSGNKPAAAQELAAASGAD
jgi:hypothetical protein